MDNKDMTWGKLIHNMSILFHRVDMGIRTNYFGGIRRKGVFFVQSKYVNAVRDRLFHAALATDDSCSRSVADSRKQDELAEGEVREI